MKTDKTPIFKGVGTALVTPFRNGDIDYPALDKLIEEQIQGGVDALIIGGTTGEAATLSESEREKLYTYATERIDGRVKVVLGTGTNDTRVAKLHTKMAKRIGCDGALAVTPYYNKGTEEGVFRHYMEIAESAELPLILYNVPSRTGVNLGFGLLSRLSEHPRIVGLKEAGDSTDRLVALAAFGDTLPLYAGNDSQIYPVLALGGAGVISVASNLLPREVKGICTDFTAGDTKSALRRQLELLPLIKALFVETNPAPVKYAMELLGLISGELRLPLATVRDSSARLLELELSRLGLIR
ncbi:MAG: 4-hydroxy-tetrahydrodipicolinate synthase [Clostridia bacterium]|nr:4-hydroxy-tetrahydrodipicolinate synthase [Clostridia bacterium]